MTSDSADEILDAGRKADDVLDVVEARLEAPFEAADQRVGVAAMQRQRADHRGRWCAPRCAPTSGVTPLRSATLR